MLLLLTLAGRASGQGTVPEYLSFQGYIEDATGTPLGQATPTNYFVVFRIYPLATGGAVLWSESQNVTFDKGNYSVLLGQGQNLNPSGTNLSAVVANASSSELYVESTVTINGTPAPILPRLRLLPTPYAFLAKKALNADQAGNATTAANATRATTADTAAFATNAGIANFAANAANANIATTALIANNVISVNGASIGDGTITQNKLEASLVTGLTGTIADSRLSASVARRNTGNIFTGNQTNIGNVVVTGNVGIGTTTPAGALDVHGDLLIRGVRPFAFKNFTVNTAVAGAVPAGTSSFEVDTLWPTANYVVTVVGFQCSGGDILEDNDPGDLVVVKAYRKSGSLNWWIRCTFRTHVTQSTWTVNAMRVPKELVTTDSTFFEN